MPIYNIYLIISLLPIAYAIASAIPVIATDFTESRVPNKITVPLLLLNLASMLGLAIWQGLWARFGLVILVALVTFVLGILLNYRDLIGMGDVKLFVALSMIIAWHNFWFGLGFLPAVMVISVFIAVAILRVLRVNVLKLSPMSYLLFIVALYIIK
jgi:Flp pilus assembly protein protease CpaA